MYSTAQSKLATLTFVGFNGSDQSQIEQFSENFGDRWILYDLSLEAFFEKVSIMGLS